MKKFIIISLLNFCGWIIGMQNEDAIIALEDKHFSSAFIVEKGAFGQIPEEAEKILARDKIFCDFSQAVVPLCTDNSTRQAIVRRVTQKIMSVPDRCELDVAAHLSRHDELYKPICQGIELAFDPQNAIKDPWYANTTKTIFFQEGTRNKCGYQGNIGTPLSLAIKRGHYHWARDLVSQGADVNQKYFDSYYKTICALYEVIKRKAEIVKFYAEKNDQDTCSNEKKVYHQFLCLLLSNKADVNFGKEWKDLFFKDVCYESPLTLAIQNRDKESILELAKYGAQYNEKDLQDEENVSWLKGLGFLGSFAAGMEQIEAPDQMVQALEKKYFHGNEKRLADMGQESKNFTCNVQLLSQTHRELDSKKTRQDIVRRLASTLWYVNDRSEHLVAKNLAQSDKSYEPIYKDIENAFDPNGYIEDSWHARATKYIPVKPQNSKAGIVGYHGGVVTPLSFAMKTSNYNWCGRLIAEGADVNQEYPDVYNNKITALYEIIQLRMDAGEGPIQTILYNILRLLLKHEANVHIGYRLICNDYHQSPLNYAISCRDEEGVRILWQYKARLNPEETLTEKDIEWFNTLGLTDN